MPEYIQWMEQHFTLFFVFCLSWIVAWALFFAWRRRTMQPIHPPFNQTDVRFTEKYVSGSSDKNLFARLGGARNALVVTVLQDAVLVEPIGVFKWLMPSGFNDLEHYVKKADIIQIEPTSSFGRKVVQIKFSTKDTSMRTLSIAVRDQDAFLTALKS